MAKTSSRTRSEAGTLLSLPINDVLPDPEQPRKYFAPDALEELKISISQHGIIQPILVRSADEEGKYIIVAGERRYRAASEVGLTVIPSILTEGNPHEISLIENLMREDLTAIEEAEAIQAMIDKHEYKQENLARVLGKGESTISEILALNKLPEEIRNDARENPRCSRRVLLEIARSKKRKNGMISLYEKFKEKGLTSGEIRKQTRGTREATPKGIIYQVTGLKNRMDSLNTEGWSEENRTKLNDEVRNLMGVMAEKFGGTDT
jgi:ParB family chromosome partitioning protein